MATKRGLSDDGDGDDNGDPYDSSESASDPQPKKAKKSKTCKPQPSKHIDPVYGQRYAFTAAGRLDTSVPKGMDSDFEDDSGAMEYLRCVR